MKARLPSNAVILASALAALPAAAENPFPTWIEWGLPANAQAAQQIPAGVAGPVRSDNAGQAQAERFATWLEWGLPSLTSVTSDSRQVAGVAGPVRRESDVRDMGVIIPY